MLLRKLLILAVLLACIYSLAFSQTEAVVSGKIINAKKDSLISTYSQAGTLGKTKVVKTPFVKNHDSLTPQQWQDDLNYLQKKVHQDYSNLFYNITANQFDSAVQLFRHRIPQLTANEIKTEFYRLIALFRIGHTGISFISGANTGTSKTLFHYYPFSAYLFSDGLYIKSIAARFKDALGGKIIQVGNTPVDEALKRLHDVIPCENEPYFRANLPYYINLPELLNGLHITPEANNLSLKYVKNGSEHTLLVPAEPFPEKAWHPEPYLAQGWVDAYPAFNTPSSALWLKHPNTSRYFEYLQTSKVLYVRHSTVHDNDDETIRGFFEKVFTFADAHEVDKFILDIRLNAGGNNYLNKPVITGIIQSRKINRYGHLFVIIGPATFSAAQNLANELEKYTEALFVGSPTGETVNYWGDIKKEELPNSHMQVALSWLWWQNMDPRDKRPYMPPHLAADMSFDNYRSGFDSSLHVALGFHSRTDIHTQLEKLAKAGEIDAIVATVQSYMANPLHRFRRYELEEKLNELGYSLLQRNKLHEASRLFAIAVHFFPQSANAYNSYAESLYHLGKKEEAIKQYQRALALDPNGVVGEDCRKMLLLLKQ